MFHIYEKLRFSKTKSKLVDSILKKVKSVWKLGKRKISRTKCSLKKRRIFKELKESKSRIESNGSVNLMLKKFKDYNVLKSNKTHRKDNDL